MCRVVADLIERCACEPGDVVARAGVGQGDRGEAVRVGSAVVDDRKGHAAVVRGHREVDEARIPVGMSEVVERGAAGLADQVILAFADVEPGHRVPGELFAERVADAVAARGGVHAEDGDQLVVGVTVAGDVRDGVGTGSPGGQEAADEIGDVPSDRVAATRAEFRERAGGQDAVGGVADAERRQRPARFEPRERPVARGLGSTGRHELGEHLGEESPPVPGQRAVSMWRLLTWSGCAACSIVSSDSAGRPRNSASRGPSRSTAGAGWPAAANARA